MSNNIAEAAVLQSDNRQNATPEHQQAAETGHKLLSDTIPYGRALESSANSKDPFDPNVPISNFSKVSDDVYRSGRPNGVEGIKEAVDKMWGDKEFDPAHAKLTTIIDLRRDTKDPQNNAEMQSEIANSKSLGVTHESFPMNAQVYQPPAFIQSVLDNIDQQKADGHRVLIHCHLGRDRTGTISAAYELTHDSQLEQLVKTDPAEAYKRGLKTMTDDGFSPKQLPALAKSLKDFVNWKHSQAVGQESPDGAGSSAAAVTSLDIPSVWK